MPGAVEAHGQRPAPWAPCGLGWALTPSTWGLGCVTGVRRGWGQGCWGLRGGSRQLSLLPCWSLPLLGHESCESGRPRLAACGGVPAHLASRQGAGVLSGPPALCLHSVVHHLPRGRRPELEGWGERPRARQHPQCPPTAVRMPWGRPSGREMWVLGSISSRVGGSLLWTCSSFI